MMKKNLVSVIIPVYNASKFIDKCLNSILSQTYSRLEIILVNDGSKDNSLEILKRYSKKYNNIYVYSQENKGAAAARNYGLSKASGDYVLFVDSDDWIDYDYVEVLLNGIKGYDFVLSGYKRYNDDKLICKKIPINCKWSSYKYNSTCGKLYKRSFLSKYKLRFSNKYKIGEDMYFTLSAISCTDKIGVLEYAGYDNYANMESVTNSVNKDKNSRNMMMLDLMKDILNSVSNSNFIDFDMLMFFFLKTSILHLMTQRYILNKEEYFLEYKTYFDWLEDVSLKYRNSKLKFKWQKGEEFSINVICNLFIFFRKCGLIKVLLMLFRLSKFGKLK